MKLLKQLIEMRGNTIAYYDAEADMGNMTNRATLLINAALRANPDVIDPEELIKWMRVRYMDFSPRLEQVVRDVLEQDMDTTPLEPDNTFEAHTPKDDEKLNKRLREVLKMVKKWKGPKKLKESDDDRQFPRVNVPASNLGELMDDLSVQDLIQTIAYVLRMSGNQINRRIIIQIAANEGVELSPEEVDILLNGFRAGEFDSLLK